MNRKRIADLFKVSLAGAFISVLLLTCFAIVYTFDLHHSVTKQMGWQCTGIEDTGNQQYPHVEVIKMWYVENPRYEEGASGPSLCADLERLGHPDVAVTFDVWGNSFQGLHGYDLVSIAAGSTPLTVYNAESGGYHGDPGYGNFDSKVDMKNHPEKYRFPIDIFK